MTDLLCCHEGRDFVTNETTHECTMHNWRGRLPCPWPKCRERDGYVRIDVDLTAGTLELIPYAETFYIRKAYMVGNAETGYTRAYFWDIDSFKPQQPLMRSATADSEPAKTLTEQEPSDKRATAQAVGRGVWHFRHALLTRKRNPTSWMVTSRPGAHVAQTDQ